MSDDETFAAAVPTPPAHPVAEPEEESAAPLAERVQEMALQVARRPETRFAAGGLLVGVLATMAALGSLLPPAGVKEARDEARLAIERLAIVQARLDALDGGRAPAAADEHAPSDEHAATGAKESGSHGAAADQAPHWSYDGATGPGRWASLANEYSACSMGHEQSPVDLAKAELEGSVDLAFHYASGGASIVDNGHTIQVDVAKGSTLELGGRHFDLVQFHFHGPSEHTVGGRSFPLEVHFVHKDAQGKLAVVGVFVEPGGANSALGPIVKSLPPTPGRAEAVDGSVDPGRMLPKQHSSFQYAGSLTTPPCTEGVAWSVLVAPVTMSQEQIDVIRGRLRGANNRPIQPLNDRTLFVDFGA
jgi:carbonic anhydrase